MSRARAVATPPRFDVIIPRDRFGVVMRHSAQTAPELCVDEAPWTFPPEVLAVQGIVPVQSVEIRR